MKLFVQPSSRTHTGMTSPSAARAEKISARARKQDPTTSHADRREDEMRGDIEALL
jgi:hypothetical protein